MKRALLTLARFAVAFSLLLWAWPLVAERYSAAVAALGNALKPQLATAALELAIDPHSVESFAVVLSARVLTSGQTINVPIDLRNLAYLPTACLVALALATPIWRSWRAPLLLIAALFTLTLFLLASLSVPLALLFADLHLLDIPPLVYAVLSIFYRALVAPPGMAYAIPGLLWLATLWTFDAALPLTAATRPRTEIRMPAEIRNAD